MKILQFKKVNIDMKLFQVILLTLLLPTIYRTFRINLLTNIPNDWGLNIASQLQWVNISFEVIQEALILPLFFFLGNSMKKNREMRKKVVNALTVTFIITIFFSILIGLNTGFLTKFMNQKIELIPATIRYIRLELVAIIFISLYKVMSVILIQLNKRRLIFKMLLVEVILTIGCDFYFIGNDNFGLHLGVNSIAYTNIIVKLLLVILIFIYLVKEKLIDIRTFLEDIDLKSTKKWIKVGSISGLESFVRNTAFVIMIIKIINEIGEQGSFWVMMNFIWGWVLLPVLALGDIIKSESSRIEDLDINKYFRLTGIIVGLWIISIPLWKPFLQGAMGLEGHNLMNVLNLSYISIIFYIIFAFNNVVDSFFYGIGRTDLMLYQSLVINIVFYGGAYIAYRQGIFQPTLIKVAIMFGLGMLMDSLVTFIQYFRLKSKKNKLKFSI